MAASPVDYLRLKVLLILESPGAAVLTHTLRSGTGNPPPGDFDHYLTTLSPQAPVNYNQLSNRERGNPFDRSQINQIRNNPSWNFDVTLLHRSIFLACEGIAPQNNAKWQDPNELEGLITKIKNKRNEIIHERTLMTDDLYDTTVTELEQAFDEILTKVKDKYGVLPPDTKLVQDEVKSRMDSIKRCFDVETLWQIGEEKLLPQFIERSRRHLKTLYQHVQDFDPLCFLKGDPHKKFPIQKMFSRLLVKTDPQNIELDCVDVLTLTQPSAPPQLPFPPSQLLVVSGVAGSGKTTLLTFISAEWVSEQQNCPVTHLDTYDLVLRVLCRERDAPSLKEFVELVLPDSFVFSSNVISLLKKCKVLFLIDGLDELNDTSKQLVNDILKFCKIVPEFTAVCTSRPERVQDFLDSAPEVCGKHEVVMQEVKPADRTEFVLKCYECLAPGGTPDPGEVSRLTDLMSDISWRDHLGLPLNLLFVTTLFVDAPHRITNSTTQTGLYVAMHEWCVEKLQVRLATKVDIDRLTREGAVKKVLKIMYRLSLKALLEDRLWLSEQDLEVLREGCKAQSLPPEELISAFFSLRKSVRNRVCHSKYYAPHKGLQEFFAAQCIVGELQDGSAGRSIRGLLQDFLQPQAVKIHAHRNLLLHVAGLLSQPEQPSLPRAIEEVVDLLAESGMKHCNEWLSLLAETEVNKDVLLRVAHYVSGSSEGERVRVTNTTVFSAAALLPYLPCKEIEIQLARETHGLDDVCGALAGHKCTRLSLEHHFKNPGQTAASGPVLQQLPDRSHLTSFEGHLDAKDLSLLPRDLHRLVLVMGSNSHELLSELERVQEKFPRLSHLGVYVPVSAVTPSSLTSLPSGLPVMLYLNGVGVREVERACDITRRLCPKDGGYYLIKVDGASLDAEGCRRLLEGVAKSGVKVQSFVGVPDTTTITEAESRQLHTLAKSLLGCQFHGSRKERLRRDFEMLRPAIQERLRREQQRQQLTLQIQQDQQELQQLQERHQQEEVQLQQVQQVQEQQVQAIQPLAQLQQLQNQQQQQQLILQLQQHQQQLQQLQDIEQGAIVVHVEQELVQQVQQEQHLEQLEQLLQQPQQRLEQLLQQPQQQQQ